MATRTADNSADFFVKHLTQGMRIFDCGSGSGTITIGLAKAVDSGQVFGIDIQPEQVARPTSLAEEKNIQNATFRVGDIHRLPFPDSSFDAVFANALLIHLAEPSKAIAEMRRVLRSGGLIGIRDANRGLTFGCPKLRR